MVETRNYLLKHNKLEIIQRKDMFNFSLDSVLLTHFATVNKKTKRIIDIGTNNAAIPLMLSTITNKEIIGIEIQTEAAILAQKNIDLNKLNDQVKIVNQ
ncbi:MAG: 50S ribosomal protein L11 methyltransferase, partial [Bacilli bacterium]